MPVTDGQRSTVRDQAVAEIRNLKPFRLLTIPIVYLISNAVDARTRVFCTHARARSRFSTTGISSRAHAYHMPPGTFVGRLTGLPTLRKHHATHHDPELMQKWKFSVTVPFWDWVHGTIHHEKA
jgi:hypothetical protein